MTTASAARAGEWDVTRLAVGLALLLTLIFFWPTLWSFTNTWGRYDYAHGWLVPGLVAWLLWSGRAAFRKGSGGDPLLLVPVVALSFFWLASMIMHIQLFHQAAFVLLMVCWALYVFGRRSARTVIVSAAVVLLSLPLWDVFLPLLRGVATTMSGAMVRLLGIPAEIQGNLIHLPAGSFEIADGCAGLNYLLSALVIGIVYAQVLVRGTRARLLVVAAAAAVAIVGNWIRIAAIVAVGHVTEMEGWLVKNHVAFGWVVFAASLLLFFFIARQIEKRAPRPARRDGAETASTQGKTAVAARRGSADAGERVKRMGTASAAAIVGPVLFFALAALPAADADEPGLERMMGGTGWRAAESEAEAPFDWSPEYQGAQRHDRLWFTNGSAHVSGDRFIYREQAQNAKLIGWPNRLARPRDVLDEQVIGPVDQAGKRWVRQAVVRTPTGPVLTWYWYRVGGVNTFIPAKAKVLEIPAFLSRRRASELIAFSAACEPDQCRNAFQALAGFMGAGLPQDTAEATESGRAVRP